MRDVYGDVIFVGIDTDRQKYPIGKFFIVLKYVVLNTCAYSLCQHKNAISSYTYLKKLAINVKTVFRLTFYV